jgi:hypothetical protein
MTEDQEIQIRRRMFAEWGQLTSVEAPDAEQVAMQELVVLTTAQETGLTTKVLWGIIDRTNPGNC